MNPAGIGCGLLGSDVDRFVRRDVEGAEREERRAVMIPGNNLTLESALRKRPSVASGHAYFSSDSPPSSQFNRPVWSTIGSVPHTGVSFERSTTDRVKRVTCKAPFFKIKKTEQHPVCHVSPVYHHFLYFVKRVKHHLISLSRRSISAAYSTTIERAAALDRGLRALHRTLASRHLRFFNSPQALP